MKSAPVRLLILATVVLLTGACSQDPSTREEPVQQSLASLVPNGAEPWPGIVTAGQPSKQEFEALRDRGLRTVINMRSPGERGTRDEPEWMEELGLTYVSIPVEGAAGLTPEVARELDQALEGAERPVLVHCGSSNRVGAVFALRAYHLEGRSADEALEVGRSAGVTKLEDRVRELLE